MKNKPINPTIQAQIKLIFSLFLLLYSPINKAQEIQKTPFYLPIHSSQLNDSIVKLNDQLLETGFDFEIKHSDLWQQYQQNIRTGKPLRASTLYRLAYPTA